MLWSVQSQLTYLYQWQGLFHNLRKKGSLTIRPFFFPTAEKHVGQLFNFRIFIKLFIHEVQKTSKFWVLGLYLLNKYQKSRFLCLIGHFVIRIYRDINFVLYDAVPPRDTQLPFATWFITTIYTYLLKEVVYHRGGTVSYRKKWNLYIFLQRNALIDIKISINDIWYTNMAPIPKTLKFSLLHELKKSIKMRKLKNLPSCWGGVSA